MTDDAKRKLQKALEGTYPVFFKSFDQAKKSQEKILEFTKSFSSLYIIIEEEGDMDDQELLGLHPGVKVYAGTAWTQIHKGRVEDGLYLSLKNS